MSSPLEQPKRITGGAFGRFLAEQRVALTKECSGKPVTAVVKLASDRFKGLSESERSEWERKYKDAQAQYEKDMEAFLAAGGEKKAVKRKHGGDDGALKKAKKQKVKDPDAPKRPVGGAYMCYVATHRAAFAKECEGKPVTAVSRLAGERWQQLSAEEKQPFVAEYDAKKVAYEEAMKSYRPAVTATEDAPKLESTPVKEPKKNATPQKVPGEGRRQAKKATANEPSQPALEASVAARAEQAGLLAPLLKLLAHQDVIKGGKSQAEVLTALVTSDGLVHPARRVLTGAQA